MPITYYPPGSSTVLGRRSNPGSLWSLLPGASFSPDDLDSLFALYDADRVSDVTVVEESDATTISNGKVSASGHVWTDDSSTTLGKRIAGVANGVVEASVDENMGLGFRCVDNANGLFTFINVNGRAQIYKRAGGSNVLLAESGVGVAAAGDTLRVSFDADRIKVWVNPTDPSTEAPVLAHTMSGADFTTFGTNTQCGFYAHDGSESACDTFTVSTLDQVADKTVAYDSDGSSAGTTDIGGFTWVQSGGHDTIDVGVADAVCDMPITGHDDAGFSRNLLFRYIDTSNMLYVRARRSTGGGELYLQKSDAAVVSTLATASSLGFGEDFDLRVVANGSRILVFLDGSLAIDHTLSGADQTKFGAATKWGMRTDNGVATNFRVRRLLRVPVWPDVSRTGTDRVNASHARQTTAASQPTLVEDWHGAGVATVLFDGVDDVMRTTSPSVSQPWSVSAVGRAENDGATTALLGFTAGTVRGLYDSAGGAWTLNGGTAWATGRTNGYVDHIHVATLDGASSKHRQDGAEGSGNAGTDPLTDFQIGNMGGGSTWALGGSVSLVALENAATTQAEAFESFAADKYGITL